MDPPKAAGTIAAGVVFYAFLASLAFVIAATVYVVARAVGLWRQTKRSGHAIMDELSRFEARAARTERLLAEAEASTARLAEAQERLRVSRARLDVLMGSLEGARRKTGWLRAFLPTG